MTAKVTEYGIISEESTEKLVKKVVQSIGKGWQPLGGAVSDGNGFFMQTIVRAGPQEDPSRRLVKA
jgi:hypothetical protein